LDRAGFVEQRAWLPLRAWPLRAHLSGMITDPGEKSEVVPNGVDTLLFKRANSEFGANWGLRVASCWLCGRAQGVGGFRSGVRSNEGFGTVKMLVVGGEGDWSETSNWPGTMASKAGWSTREQWPMRGSRLCCGDGRMYHPFRENAIAQNAVPLKLFEYMACEKPVISSPCCSKGGCGDRVLYASGAEELKR